LTRRHAIQVLTLLPLVIVLIGGMARLWPCPALVVWSCGGNYELLKEYVAAFEAREGVQVRYTAAPAAFLLARALNSADPPDVIVGRGGPGWDSLQDVGLCAEPPLVFAADLLVVAVAAGNPKEIRSVEDMGREGVRVAMSPGAMKPKSKVPGMFMMAVSAKLYPGLVERWENNAVVRETCGRKLFDSLLDGRADAAIAPRSLLFYGDYRGKVEEVQISATELLTMRACPAIPQCAVSLSGKDGVPSKLAQRFVAGLAKDREGLGRHGYMPVEDPRAKPLGRLLKALAPKNMAGWQILLAEKLDEAGLSAETRRRYLKVLCTFGPNRYTARALCNTASQALAEGNPQAARLDWQRVLADYPPQQPSEYGLSTSAQRARHQPVQALSYEHWRRQAKAGLARAKDAGGRPAPVTEDPLVQALFPILLSQGDPPKNSTRDLALGLHLMVAGDYEFATRDLLKVATLHYPSRHMPVAEYLLGLCAEARGQNGTARRQWERTVRDCPGSRSAELAEQALARLPTAEKTSDGGVMPVWTECFGTHPDRAMTYGMRLYAHRLPLFTFKEMAKILSGIYGKHKLGGRARLCAGVACDALGNEDAAAYQWQVCLHAAASTHWADRAAKKLAQLGKQPVPQPRTAPGKPAKGSAAKRFRLAEEFFRAGVHEQGQIVLEYLKVLTVARPPLESLTPPTRGMLGKATKRLTVCLVRAGHSASEARDLVHSLPGAQAFLAAPKPTGSGQPDMKR
jgi:ABC-type molybdate transport system substrate-binding protein